MNNHISQDNIVINNDTTVSNEEKNNISNTNVDHNVSTGSNSSTINSYNTISNNNKEVQQGGELSGDDNSVHSYYSDYTGNNQLTPKNNVTKIPTTDSNKNANNTKDTNQNDKENNKEDDNDDDTPVDPRDLEWDNPEDPDNPHNWKPAKKWAATMVAACTCLVVTMGSSLYVSGVPELMVRYHISQTLSLSGLTFYLLGLSSIIGAPLSEVFGRKPIYVTSIPLSMLFTMGVCLSNGHMRIILPCRFLSGFFASPALSIASGTLVDMWDVDLLSPAMTYFCLAPFLGPVIAPIMGSYACASMKNFRWSAYIQLFAGGIITPFLILMPETHKVIVLKKRAQKRGVNLKKPTKEELKTFLKLTMTITIFRPLKMLFVEPIVLVFSIYVAFIFAVLFGFFEAFAVIYRGIYLMDDGNSSLPFLGIGIGLWMGSFFYLWYDRKFFFPKAPSGTPLLVNSPTARTMPYRGHRNPETGELLPLKPETFLVVTKIGSIALPIALFWQGWTARKSVQWMAPIAAGVPFGFGLILIFFSVMMYFSTSYPPLYVASALAANNLLRYVTSCVFPLFTIQMYEKMHVYWASSFFGFVCIAMIPVPWLFEIYGPKLRHRSQFGFAAMEKGTDDDDENVAELTLTRTYTEASIAAFTDDHSSNFHDKNKNKNKKPSEQV
ncbi:related to Polyamine transporter 4 [Saccharomycodes ludwigii]|uniref:Related to Polyamine transporter 4 n=1 Tax=Saccharomycodes ludwigii TaxID=36035 RepID=A0A376BAR5_9ASCO|nr:hypothetical protein SCDLUD_002209 [Saccharomycodes ludwigii]KAH3902388.1 hypothetical protein SCDLUD_002209 [Saccharomycodes ludwigii]SSD61691.1 related to Polyamine transporter 4 [Saccharomycodes ludwigii]